MIWIVGSIVVALAFLFRRRGPGNTDWNIRDRLK